MVHVQKFNFFQENKTSRVANNRGNPNVLIIKAFKVLSLIFLYSFFYTSSISLSSLALQIAKVIKLDPFSCMKRCTPFHYKLQKLIQNKNYKQPHIKIWLHESLQWENKKCGSFCYLNSQRMEDAVLLPGLVSSPPIRVWYGGWVEKPKKMRVRVRPWKREMQGLLPCLVNRKRKGKNGRGKERAGKMKERKLIMDPNTVLIGPW